MEFPELKAAGAAYATVIGQIASFMIALFFHFGSNKSVDKSVKYDDLGNAWIEWLTFPISEVITGMIAVCLMLNTYKKKVRDF